jgi:hypothetical protein
MATPFLDKLKKTVIDGATTTAQKVEDAARLGKLHLDVLNERRKMQNAHSELGVLVYKNVESDAWEHLKEQVKFVELVGQISEIEKNIDHLQHLINTSRKDGKEKEV